MGTPTVSNNQSQRLFDRLRGLETGARAARFLNSAGKEAARIRESGASLPALVRKPFLMRLWILTARKAQIGLAIVVLLLTFVAPPSIGLLTDYLYPDTITKKSVLGIFERNKINANLLRSKRYQQILVGSWVIGLGFVLVMLINHIPVTIALGKERARSMMAEAARISKKDPDHSERLQRSATALLIGEQEKRQTAAPEDRQSGKQAEKTRLISLTNPKEKRFIGPDQRYRIEKVIGSGGAGVVHEGYDTVLERPVALKQLFASLVQDAEHMERFRQEALALASLSHPHIVPIYDLLEDSGHFWIVMEILSGGSLGERIDESKAMDITDSVEIACCIAEGLGFAHSEGVVHRDVKPMNVLFSANGTPKLTDFGTAKLTESGVQTREGLILGSPAYMSPEQSAGESVDKRSDIYSLGISLYQMLTGNVPFSGKSTGQILAQHITQAPQPPSELNKKIPERLQEVILAMLNKKPADRFKDTNSLISALRKSIPVTAG